MHRRLILGAALPDGPAAVRETLKLMRDLSRDFRNNDTIRTLALELVEDLPQKAFRAEIQRIFEFVLNEIRYVQDSVDTELVHTPIQVLERGQGDCDDKAVLLHVLLASIGHRSRFVAVGFERDVYQHVFVETLVHSRGGFPRWLALDATELGRPFGWRPPNPVEVMVTG